MSLYVEVLVYGDGYEVYLVEKVVKEETRIELKYFTWPKGQARTGRERARTDAHEFGRRVARVLNVKCHSRTQTEERFDSHRSAVSS